MDSTPITIESNPLEKDYEDYICAHFQCGGYYVEKSIIHREKEEILELDIIITDFNSEGTTKKLVEIKSGGWGFNEIFKVKGWLVYLKVEHGLFIVKKNRQSIDYFQKKAQELDIHLIDNFDLSKTNECLINYLKNPISEKETTSLRFSYLLERKMLKQIKDFKKEYPDNVSYKNLDDYFFKINSGSFFSSNPISRIKQIFETYVKYKNITAKLCHELRTNEYNEEITELSNECFVSLFYKAQESPLYIALYIEHIARLTILKACTEELLRNHHKSFGEDNFIESLDYLSIPQSIKNGLAQIVTEPYFHRYPIFWQFFTYVMGGFILTDLREKEYKYISENTGIPIEEIPNAFDCFNKLFPKLQGWMFNLPNSNILWHRFFPIPFSGVGANHRRYLHINLEDGNVQSYEELGKIIKGGKTMNDLTKWNNLVHSILK